MRNPLLVAKKPALKIMVEPTITVAPEPPAGNRPDRISSSGSSLRPSAASLSPPSEPKRTQPRAVSRRARSALVAALALLMIAVVVHPLRSLHHVTMHVSGSPTPRLTPSGAREHWPVGSSIAVVLDPSLGDANVDAAEAVTNAFATWNEASTGAPSIAPTLASSPGVAAEDGVNRVVYAPITIPGLETAVAVTVSYADDDGVILEADTILNNAYAFTVLGRSDLPDQPAATCGNRYDVQNVATHEAGHLLGMGEDMTDEANTMFITSVPCQVHKRTPTSADIASMKALYADVPATATHGAGGCSEY
jgi:hypothetical protein